MASAWGSSWGAVWGDSWGAIAQPAPAQPAPETGGNITGFGYSTEDERWMLRQQIERDERLLKKAQDFVQHVEATGHASMVAGTAEALSAQLRQRLDEINAEFEIDSAYREAMGLFATYTEAERVKQNLLELQQRMAALKIAIEEIDVVFVMFVLVATDHDDRGSG